MYVKNMTQYNQQFKAAGTGFTIRPGKTVSMTEEEVRDHTVQFLLARGILKVLDEDEGLGNVIAEAEERQAEAEERKMEVSKAGEDTTKQVIMVQCAGQTRSGERCQRNVNVNLSEYGEDTPYFCSTHKNEDPANYERKDGAWVKRLAASEDVEVAPDDEPQEEPQVDAITDEDIAEALAEAAEEE